MIITPDITYGNNHNRKLIVCFKTIKIQKQTRKTWTIMA